MWAERGLESQRALYRSREEPCIAAASSERPGMRGIERLFGVAQQTVAAWLKKSRPGTNPEKAAVAPARVRDKLEVDEVWSFVGRTAQKRWLWTALCRRIRQIVAFTLGDHSARVSALVAAVPPPYKRCRRFSDFWETYRKVFPAKSHRSVGEASGDQSHGTLEQYAATG